MSDLNHITDELYRLHTIIAEQGERIAALEREIAELRERLAVLSAPSRSQSRSGT